MGSTKHTKSNCHPPIPGPINSTGLFAATLLAAFLLLGCGAMQASSTTPTAVFTPRNQNAQLHLMMAFSSESDMAPKSGNWFLEMIAGSDSPEKLLKPYGAAVRNGELYIADTGAATVKIVNLRDRSFRSLPGDKGRMKLMMPVNLAFDVDGNLYVTDPMHKRVFVYDAEGNYKTIFGTDDKFKPSGVAVYENRVYVTDLGRKRLLAFDRNTGDVVMSKKFSDMGFGKKAVPANLTVDGDGNILICDMMGANMLEVTPAGEFKRQLKGKTGSHVPPIRPKGIAVDRSGNVYVADSMTGMVHMFDDKDDHTLAMGERETSPVAFTLPAGAIISYDPASIAAVKEYSKKSFDPQYLLVVVSQYGDNQISIFGYTKTTPPTSDIATSKKTKGVF